MSSVTQFASGELQKDILEVGRSMQYAQVYALVQRGQGGFGSTGAG